MQFLKSSFFTYFILAILFTGTLPITSYSQLSQGGIPLSLQYNLSKSNVPVLDIPAPDAKKIEIEDGISTKDGLPYRYAVNLPVNIDILKEASLEELSNGDHLYRLEIHAKDALALGCYFDDFYLPEGSSVFLYSYDKKQTIGSFTSLNNQDNFHFATELIQGDKIILEYYEPASAQGFSSLHLNELSYAYRGVYFKRNENTRGFGGSGACEVNINCSEGQNWQNQKKGVVRIGVKVNGSSYWCTGTLLNNVNQDYKPYLLTADHCGSTASVTDLSQWVFYFNYESLDCPDPNLEPSSKTLTGAKKKASSGGGGSQIKESDLYLVLLNNMVPDNYNTFYCGWNRLNSSSTSGVSIHHPEGDIKKISTYLTPLISSSWGSTPGSHWSVKWSATSHGHGVTEPGSSGSPLFNMAGEVIGQLSGGESSCSNVTAADLYGKFSYSWQPAGSDSSNSLHHWLDPLNSGTLSVPGLGSNFVYVVANFTVDQDTFIVGRNVNFTDLSSGDPTSWKWTFLGAEPSSSTEQNPQNITYNRVGIFPVSLIATNSSIADTVEKRKYIIVYPNIYPNPFNDHFTIDLGEQFTQNLEIEMYDMLGRAVNFFVKEENPGTRYGVYIKNRDYGVYYIKIRTDSLNINSKVWLQKTP